MKTIRIGVIGAGRFGIYHLHAFRQMESKSAIQLAAISELDPVKRKLLELEFNIPIYSDYKEMIEKEDLTAVSIATQDHLHKDVAILALSKGLHLFVEKPLDVSSEGAREISDLAKNNNLLLQVDFHKRYDPYHIEIKQLIEQNKFGNFLYGYCHMEDKIIVPRDWFKDWVSHSSPIWFLGCHFIDLMIWLMGSKPVSVYAKGQKIKLKGLGIDTFDAIQSMITFENNAVITFDNSWILPEQFSSIVNQGFRLIGTEGIIEADSENRGTLSCFSSENGVRNHNSGFMYTIKESSGNEKYVGYGIDSIQHFAKNLCSLNNGETLESLNGTYPSGRDGYEVSKVSEAIHISINSGKEIVL
ncbi:MAG: Gfo/Idh/MocA family oxidoreductase [Bacteroidetes bacterium]|nr:Gfo/Idh/MocA family oxidoreductase [Bacteroidota bacterium]MBU1116510.1 Gfo/Idh/MocA family oxidoreductase [Bacteroidota bacterium]MBU1798767.1 Gfo/Idh/MocA family oxidoreductase [Bacteroidota bacterium]